MTRLVKPARLLLAAYVALLAVALLSPTSTVQSGIVTEVSRLLTSLGVPPWLASYDRVEVALNACLVVPVGFLGSMALPRTSWRDWTAYAFVGAVAVEVAQGLLLPGRQAAMSDVVANTAGAFLGAVLFVGVRPMLRTDRSG